MTREESYNNVVFWINEIKNKGKEKALIVLVGNKTDKAGRKIK